MKNDRLLEVGIDQFTLTLHETDFLREFPWNNNVNGCIHEFIEKARFLDLCWNKSKVKSGKTSGYSQAIYLSACEKCYILIEWNNRKPTLGIRIFFTAFAWARYQYDCRKKGWEMNFWIFIQHIRSDMYDISGSRIDMVADFKNYPDYVHPMCISQELDQGKLCLKNRSGSPSYYKEPIKIYNGEICNTIIFGSVTGNSTHYFRIYDKKREVEAKNNFRAMEALGCKSWIRFEIVFRKELARNIIREMQTEILNGRTLSSYISQKITEKYIFFRLPGMKKTSYTEELEQIQGDYKLEHLRVETITDISLKKTLLYIKTRSGLYDVASLIMDIAENIGESPFAVHCMLFSEIFNDVWHYRNNVAPNKKDYQTKRKKILGVVTMESILDSIKEIFGSK